MIVTRNLSKQGAIVIEGRHRIPEFAKVTLDKWALKRVQDLKIVTKAHKYTFPFHDRYHQKRAYRKVFEIIKKQLERQIPYLPNATVPFMDIGGATSETIIFRIGPYPTDKSTTVLLRYLSKLNRLIRNSSLPFSINARRNSYYMGLSVTYLDILEIKVTLNRVTISDGYLMLYYLPELMKVIETLHRKACYATT